MSQLQATRSLDAGMSFSKERSVDKLMNQEGKEESGRAIRNRRNSRIRAIGLMDLLLSLNMMSCPCLHVTPGSRTVVHLTTYHADVNGSLITSHCPTKAGGSGLETTR